MVARKRAPRCGALSSSRSVCARPFDEGAARSHAAKARSSSRNDASPCNRACFVTASDSAAGSGFALRRPEADAAGHHRPASHAGPVGRDSCHAERARRHAALAAESCRGPAGYQSTTLEIREEENYWRSKQKETAALRDQLLVWANAAQAGVQQLQQQQPVWNQTLNENEHTPDLGPTLDVIKKSVADLQKVTKRTQDRYASSSISRSGPPTRTSSRWTNSVCCRRLASTSTAVSSNATGLPLWQVGQRRTLGENRDSYSSATSRLLGIRAFLGQASGPISALVVLLILSLFGAYRLNVATKGKTPKTESQAQALHLAKHWIALGVLPSLLFGYLLSPLAPLPLIGLVILVSFVPILVLLPPHQHSISRAAVFDGRGVHLQRCGFVDSFRQPTSAKCSSWRTFWYLYSSRIWSVPGGSRGRRSPAVARSYGCSPYVLLSRCSASLY